MKLEWKCPRGKGFHEQVSKIVFTACDGDDAEVLAKLALVFTQNMNGMNPIRQAIANLLAVGAKSAPRKRKAKVK